MTSLDAHPARLIVGHDGSPEDDRVGEVAAAAALALGASIELVRALDLAEGDGPDSGPSQLIHAAFAERVAERRRDAEAELARVRAELRRRAEGRVEIRSRVVDGRPHEAIRKAADESGCWIVVGARRARSVLGRTVDQVLRRTIRPVLVVPDGSVWREKGPVLTGIDAGELDARVLGVAEAVAASLSRRMGVVHVRTTGDEATMLRVTEHVRAIAPSVSASATLGVMRVEGSIAATLAEHARRVDASLLVVGTHGRRGLERWMLGSTAESLAHLSTIPFLVVR